MPIDLRSVAGLVESLLAVSRLETRVEAFRPKVFASTTCCETAGSRFPIGQPPRGYRSAGTSRRLSR